MTFAVLALGLLDRRTARREVIQGSGFIACAVVAASAIYAFAFLAVRIAMTHGPDRSTEITVQFNNFFGRVTYLATPMILGAWLALALVGRRRSPTWIDRLGVLIGVCITLLFLTPRCYHLVQPLIR